jgi:hypothetical protein
LHPAPCPDSFSHHNWDITSARTLLSLTSPPAPHYQPLLPFSESVRAEPLVPSIHTIMHVAAWAGESRAGAKGPESQRRVRTINIPDFYRCTVE